jgi:hypothetical protein
MLEVQQRMRKIKGWSRVLSGHVHRLDNLASSVGMLELSGDELNSRATKDLCESLVRFVDSNNPFKLTEIG